MALYQRTPKGIFYIDITSPNGKRIRQSTGTADKLKAQEYHDNLKAELWRVERLGDKPRRTWKDAVVKWVKETSHKKDHQKDRSKLRWLDQHLGDLHLDQIGHQTVERVAEAKEEAGVSPATVNRYLALIRSILNKACNEWEWIERVPKVRMRREPKGRERFLTPEEARRLLEELPEHLETMGRFALMTGLRESNVTGLMWSRVNLESSQPMIWVDAADSKTDRAIGVPLNPDAIEVLKSQEGKHETYVFTYRGEPVTRTSNSAWYAAVKRAGLEGFRWHDLRHTWASWHAQGGTPLMVLQELGGWASAAMPRRYAHLGVQHTAQHSSTVSGLINGTISAHQEN